MKPIKIGLAIISALWAVGTAWGATEASGGTVSVSKEIAPTKPYGFHMEHKRFDILYSIMNGSTTNKLKYNWCQDVSHTGCPTGINGPVDLLSGLGQIEPIAGWYAHGFIDLSINDVSLGKYHAKDKPYMSGDKGGVTFTWETSEAKINMVLYKFLYEDGLYVDISIEPKTDIANNIKVKLLAIPSTYKLDGARFVQTQSKIFDKLPGTQSYSPKENENWLFYADSIYDGSAVAKGVGACGVVFELNCPNFVEFVIGNSIGTTLSYPADTKRIRLCFFNFLRKCNNESVGYFNSLLGKVNGHFASK